MGLPGRGRAFRGRALRVVRHDQALHALAATPLFVAQPIALLALGHRLREDRPRLAKGLLATGLLTAAAAVGFIVSGDDRAGGALERLALWPVLFGLGAFAWGQRPRPRRASAGGA